MIRVKLYQNKNEKNETAYNKWYPRVIVEETIGLEELSAHMASHNTPFSKGAIKGILTDAVACTKELLLMGKNVKFPDLAIFSVGLRVLGGAPTPEARRHHQVCGQAEEQHRRPEHRRRSRGCRRP